MGSVGRCLFIILIFSNLSCSVNILESFADKTTNEALLNDAKILINAGNYSAALVKIAEMSSSYQADRAIVALKASAHAGLCGLNFFDFVLALQNIGSTRLLPFLISSFRSGASTTKIDECVTAENLIESIGVSTARTTDENLLLALISFAKIGTVLSYYVDSNQDGTATSGYDVCTIGGARTAGGSMPDTDARELGSGITLAIENIQAISGEVSLGSASLTQINSACTSLGVYNFCSKTDPTTFSASELLAIRSLAREGSAVGLDLNGCSGGDISNGSCRCF